MSNAEPGPRYLKDLLNKAHAAWVGIDRGTHTNSDLDEILNPQLWADPDIQSSVELTPDENLYLVSRRHTESNEVIFDTPVNICTQCGTVYIFKPYRLGQCPNGHDQKRPNPHN